MNGRKKTVKSDERRRRGRVWQLQREKAVRRDGVPNGPVPLGSGSVCSGRGSCCRRSERLAPSRETATSQTSHGNRKQKFWPIARTWLAGIGGSAGVPGGTRALRALRASKAPQHGQIFTGSARDRARSGWKIFFHPAVAQQELMRVCKESRAGCNAAAGLDFVSSGWLRTQTRPPPVPKLGR